MIFRIRYEVAGGHTHCALFSAKAPNATFAKCGDFTIRNEEFATLAAAMRGVEFLEKETT